MARSLFRARPRLLSNIELERRLIDTYLSKAGRILVDHTGRHELEAATQTRAPGEFETIRLRCGKPNESIHR